MQLDNVKQWGEDRRSHGWNDCSFASGSAFLDAAEDQGFPGVEPLLEPACCGFFLEVFSSVAVEYISVTGLDQGALGVDLFYFPLSLGILSMFSHGCIYTVEICISCFPVLVDVMPDDLCNTGNSQCGGMFLGGYVLKN